MTQQGGKFEVTDHCELTGRGGLVIGRIVDGVIRAGMAVPTGLDPVELTIAGVEFLDNVSARKHWNAFLFSERPTLEFVKRAFPLGSVIDAT